MALTEENGGGSGMVMPVSPMYGGGGYGNNGFGNGDGWWIILLFLLAFNGGWGGYGNGGGGGGSTPYIIDNSVQRGFDQSAIMSALGDIQGAICNGFAGVEASANARQIADMQNSFALQSQLAECCCENRLATADLKYTVATENCADRYEAAQNTRDIIDSQTKGTQAILDKLCALEISAKDDEIAQLRQEVLYARGQASQIAQNAQIVDSIYNRLDTCPVGTTPVYGRTAIFSCNNNGCGCGNGSF